jgi:DNA-binding CsgD family transcriptional regulator
MDYRGFSKRDLTEILDLIQSAVACSTEAGLSGLVMKAGEIVCADHSICGLAACADRSASGIKAVVNGNYPSEWLRLYTAGGLYEKDPVIRHQYAFAGTQLWSDTFRNHEVSPDFLRKAGDFGLNFGVSGGVNSTRDNLSSIFTFSGPNDRFKTHQRDALEIMAPHLHQALARIYGVRGAVPFARLSGREREIIRWAKDGKTNWEISTILDISERTVKFHIQNVERKLNAVNKAQAVAIALEQGLVS